MRFDILTRLPRITKGKLWTAQWMVEADCIATAESRAVALGLVKDHSGFDRNFKAWPSEQRLKSATGYDLPWLHIDDGDFWFHVQPFHRQDGSPEHEAPEFVKAQTGGSK